jgi:hypothetical protein
MLDSFATLKRLYWRCDLCAFLGHLFAAMRSDDRAIALIVRDPSSAALDAEASAQAAAVEASLQRFLARIERMARPEMLAALLAEADSDERRAAKEMLETGTKLYA